MSQNKVKKYPGKRKRQKAKWTPILLVLGGAMLIFLSISALRDKPTGKPVIEVSGAPSLKVDQEKIDLGEMKFNEVADVSFKLTNVGDQTLRFTDKPSVEVKEGC